jgi:hypothetical protein
MRGTKPVEPVRYQAELSENGFSDGNEHVMLRARLGFIDASRTPPVGIEVFFSATLGEPDCRGKDSRSTWSWSAHTPAANVGINS